MDVRPVALLGAGILDGSLYAVAVRREMEPAILRNGLTR